MEFFQDLKQRLSQEGNELGADDDFSLEDEMASDDLLGNTTEWNLMELEARIAKEAVALGKAAENMTAVQSEAGAAAVIDPALQLQAAEESRSEQLDKKAEAPLTEENDVQPDIEPEVAEAVGTEQPEEGNNDAEQSGAQINAEVEPPVAEENDTEHETDPEGSEGELSDSEISVDREPSVAEENDMEQETDPEVSGTEQPDTEENHTEFKTDPEVSGTEQSGTEENDMEPCAEPEEIETEQLLSGEAEQDVQEPAFMSAVRMEIQEDDMDENEFAGTDTAVITEGMTITGDVAGSGNINLTGTVTGNITVRGKLNVTGCITGNSEAAEICAEGAQIDGEIKSDGNVRIGPKSVVIGNIFATSAVIAGAVKGDIDVQGPVVLDASAIIMGNIRSRSVQINNGAVIEGMCSQCYADISPTSFFDDLKKTRIN